MNVVKLYPGCSSLYYYQTSDPSLIVYSKYNSMRNLVEYERQLKLFTDPKLLEFKSLRERWSYSSERMFVDICTENDIPRLKDLRKYFPKLEDDQILILAYKNLDLHDGNYGTKYYNSDKIFELLQDAILTNRDESDILFLFEKCIERYVYEKTDKFSDRAKSKRFNLICNTSLRSSQWDSEVRKDHKKMIGFIKTMKKRNIYEFMFNEYQ